MAIVRSSSGARPLPGSDDCFGMHGRSLLQASDTSVRFGWVAQPPGLAKKRVRRRDSASLASTTWTGLPAEKLYSLPVAGPVTRIGDFLR